MKTKAQKRAEAELRQAAHEANMALLMLDAYDLDVQWEETEFDLAHRNELLEKVQKAKQAFEDLKAKLPYAY